MHIKIHKRARRILRRYKRKQPVGRLCDRWRRIAFLSALLIPLTLSSSLLSGEGMVGSASQLAVRWVYEKEAREAGKEAGNIAASTRITRLKISLLRQILQDLGQVVDPSDPLILRELSTSERDELTKLRQDLTQRTVRLHIGYDGITKKIAARLKRSPLGRLMQRRDVSAEVLAARQWLAEVLEDLDRIPGEIVALQEDRQELSALHAAAREKVEVARAGVALTLDQLAAVQKEQDAVDRDVARAQRQLRRVTARLKAKIERDLLEKGLIPPRSERKGIQTEPKFRWPVQGRRTAGFYDHSYKAYFGVAHKGIDLAVPQGTPVTAAADGIVMLVRDSAGYSYVLIGHNSGYATLYGHLSHISVTKGQAVSAGQGIGSSGGIPGTRGAGLMTTGAHLHFEMMHDGEHIDPKSKIR